MAHHPNPQKVFGCLDYMLKEFQSLWEPIGFDCVCHSCTTCPVALKKPSYAPEMHSSRPYIGVSTQQNHSMSYRMSFLNSRNISWWHHDHWNVVLGKFKKCFTFLKTWLSVHQHGVINVFIKHIMHRVARKPHSDAKRGHIPTMYPRGNISLRLVRVKNEA